jgi:quinoprotein glucose dehydrogenase
VRPEDVIDFTPELRQQALAILDRHDWGPLYTPPTQRGTIFLPGQSGGASWAGAAVDPATGWLYVTSRTFPIVTKLSRPGPILQLSDWYVGETQPLFGPERLPLFKPPFGRVVAIDLNTGDHAWTVPLGEGPRKHPLLAPLDLPRLGSPRRGFLLVTRTLPSRPRKAPDRCAERPIARGCRSGRSPAGAHARGVRQDDRGPARADRAARECPRRPHDLHGGDRHIVVPVGGANLPAELVALSLP